MSQQLNNLHQEQDSRLSGKEGRPLDLLILQPQKPWLVAFFANLKDYFFPAKEPPLLVTSRPLSPKEIGQGSIIYSPALDTNLSGGQTHRASVFQPGVPVDSDHLQRLAETGVEVPWYVEFYENIRDYFFPPKQPPLELTAKPVQVKSIWGFSAGNERRAGLITASLHVGAIAILFALGSSHIIKEEPKISVRLIAPDLDIAPYIPQAPKPKQMGGGGGGGDRSPTPASKGQLPKVAPRQFVPPAVVVHNPAPRLVMEPTIVVPPDVPLPKVNINAWGDPLARVGPPSSGPGSGGGIGSGSGGGVGSGRGPGFGPGEGGGVGGGVYRIGGGVTAPTLIHKVEPEYSEEARKAKFQGTVVLYVVVDEKGMPKDIKVVRPLGLGLDEKAVEAVEKWRFRPGYLNGKAVAVAATVEVNFRLL
jgi:TonB family protein